MDTNSSDTNRSQDVSTPRTGRYLYAVVPAGKADKLDLDVLGVEDGEVYPLMAGQVAAIVSDIAPEPLRPQRKHLAAHQAVLRKLMEQAPLLPVAFGIIPDGEQEVRDLLKGREEDFLAQLGQLGNQVEMGLRCRLQGPNTFQYFLDNYPELRDRRDAAFSAGEPSREQKIELGKAFQELLERVRQEVADTVQQQLGQVARRTRINDPRNESELLNMAVLVPRDRQDAFQQAVQQVAAKLPDAFQLDVTGPWPPYNFVDLRIHLEPTPEEAH